MSRRLVDKHKEMSEGMSKGRCWVGSGQVDSGRDGKKSKVQGRPQELKEDKKQWRWRPEARTNA